MVAQKSTHILIYSYDTCWRSPIANYCNRTSSETSPVSLILTNAINIWRRQATINNQQQQNDVRRAHRAYHLSWWFHGCWPWDRHHLEGPDWTLSIRAVELDQSSFVSAFQRAKNDICILLCLRALAAFSLFAQMDALCFQLWDGQRHCGNNTVSINWRYCQIDVNCSGLQNRL